MPGPGCSPYYRFRYGPPYMSFLIRVWLLPQNVNLPASVLAYLLTYGTYLRPTYLGTLARSMQLPSCL